MYCRVGLVNSLSCLSFCAVLAVGHCLSGLCEYSDSALIIVGLLLHTMYTIVLSLIHAHWQINYACSCTNLLISEFPSLPYMWSKTSWPVRLSVVLWVTTNMVQSMLAGHTEPEQCQLNPKIFWWIFKVHVLCMCYSQSHVVFRQCSSGIIWVWFELTLLLMSSISLSACRKCPIFFFSCFSISTLTVYFLTIWHFNFYCALCIWLTGRGATVCAC